MRNVAITGWGWYCADRVMTNEEFGPLIEASSVWIQTRRTRGRAVAVLLITRGQE